MGLGLARSKLAIEPAFLVDIDVFSVVLPIPSRIDFQSTRHILSGERAKESLTALLASRSLSMVTISLELMCSSVGVIVAWCEYRSLGSADSTSKTGRKSERILDTISLLSPSVSVFWAF